MEEPEKRVTSWWIPVSDELGEATQLIGSTQYSSEAVYTEKGAGAALVSAEEGCVRPRFTVGIKNQLNGTFVFYRNKHMCMLRYR